jgi:hypothetical protein
MENQQGEPAWLFAVSHNAVPCAIPTKGNESFVCRELLHCSPSFCTSLMACTRLLCLCEQMHVSLSVRRQSCQICVFIAYLDVLPERM